MKWPGSRVLLPKILLPVSLALAALPAPSAHAGTAGDVALSGYYAGKAAIPFLFLSVAIEDGDMVLLSTLGLFSVMTVPSSGVLIQRWAGDPEKVGVWRKIALSADFACAGGGVLYGLWQTTQSGPENAVIDNQAGGTLVILASILYGLASLPDLIPFSTESGRYSKLSVMPVYAIHSHQAGLAWQYRF